MPEYKTPAADTTVLKDFLRRHQPVLALTGAGCSTASAIPDYRDGDGNWKRQPPVLFQDFVNNEPVRRRYWGRSIVGWRHFARAEPNGSHAALATLESKGLLSGLITQNVDDLHQRAGSRQVLALHGTLDRVRCLACDYGLHRDAFQRRLADDNPHFATLTAPAAPDGDADLDAVDFSRLTVPGCPRCDGILKPDVVFYGESVPAGRYRTGEKWLRRAGALLVVGSSLMVYSSFRFARLARESGKPIAAVNLGKTRADEFIKLKVEAPCEGVLPQLVGG